MLYWQRIKHLDITIVNMLYEVPFGKKMMGIMANDIPSRGLSLNNTFLRNNEISM